MYSRKLFNSATAAVGAVGIAAGLATAMNPFNHPELLLQLPTAIVKNVFSEVSHSGEFNDSNRKELHEFYTNFKDISWFDSMTIPPVNKTLDVKGVPLTRDALVAIKDDVTLSAEQPSTPQEAVIKLLKQARSQVMIAEAFFRAREPEGGLMHEVIGGAFAARALVVENALRQLEDRTSPPGLGLQ